MENTRSFLRCLRCGWSWPPRIKSGPKNCPKCKSPYWNKPRSRAWLSGRFLSAKAARKAREVFSVPAKRAVQEAIAAGLLPNLQDKNHKIKCTDCESRATEYDHREYLKPLKVEPVCKSCNIKRGPAKEVISLRCRKKKPRYEP